MDGFGDHGTGDAASGGFRCGGDDAEGVVGFPRVNEADAEEGSGSGVTGGDGLVGVEGGVGVGDEAEGFGGIAEAGALAEVGLVPGDEGGVEEGGGGRVVVGEEGGEGVGHRIADCGLRIADCGLGIGDCGLWRR